MTLLRHHPDLLRQRRAAPRPRLLDDRRRHPRPPHAPARRGRLLPDRHRRARRADRARGRARGDHAAGAGRPQRRRSSGADADHRRLQRLLHPHHRPAPRRARSRRSSSASTTTAGSTKGIYEGWYCPRCADFKTERELGPGQHLPDPRDPARAGARGELVLPPLRLPGAARSALRGAARLRRPRLPPQRGGLLHQAGARGRLALAAEAEVGDAAALGPRAADVRLVRRAAQLLHGARLRPRGRGPDRALLAGRPARDRPRTSSSSTR